MKRKKSDLPFGSQFSPSQISIEEVLELVNENRGATRQFTNNIRDRFFDKHANGDPKQQMELAKNVRLSLRSYGIIGEDEQMTEFGKRLYELKDRGDEFYKLLSQHILLELKGLDLLRAVSNLKALRLQTDLVSIARELKEYGIYVPESGTHISTMKQWLQKAGIVDEQWNINQTLLRKLIGYNLQEIDVFSDFGPEMRGFLRALASLAPIDWISSWDVARHAQSMSHVKFDAKNLREQIIFPLRDEGLIEIRKSTSGRGAKPYEIKVTDEFKSQYILPILEVLSESGDVPIHTLSKPLFDVLNDVESDDTYIKGKGLEMLAMHLCRLLGLHITSWRRRGTETGGAEVDLIAEGTNYVFSRWELQCKNTSQVTLDNIAREVGVSLHSRANAILIVTTGKFSRDAVSFAEQTTIKSPLSIILMDAADLRQVISDPSSIGAILRKQANKAMQLNKQIRPEREG